MSGTADLIILSDAVFRGISPGEAPAPGGVAVRGARILAVGAEERLGVARWSLLVYSVLGIGMALLELPKLYEIALIVYEGIAQVIPMLIFSLYWKRSNKYGAFVGFIAGLAVAILYGVFGDASHWSGGVIGLVVNVVIHVAFGYIFPKDPHVDNLFAVVQEYEEGGELARKINAIGKAAK